VTYGKSRSSACPRGSRPRACYSFSGFGRSSTTGGQFVLESADTNYAVGQTLGLVFAGNGSWNQVATPLHGGRQRRLPQCLALQRGWHLLV
jgi:hypothetical protein